MPLPTVLVSSIVRLSSQGEAHGLLDLVDLESGNIEHKIEWNDEKIDWSGRGTGRGLLGIVYHGDEVYIGASEALLVFDRQLRHQRSFRSPYLKQTHAIASDGRRIFVTSTGFDSLLTFDLDEQRFTHGLMIRMTWPLLTKLSWRVRLPDAVVAAALRGGVRPFDPKRADGPSDRDTVHLNNVQCHDGRLTVSAYNLTLLLEVRNDTVRPVARLPIGTHDVMPLGDALLMNNTARDEVLIASPAGRRIDGFPIVDFAEDALVNADLPRTDARQCFARGLCTHGDDIIIGGSSPATISVYSRREKRCIKTVNLSMDVRHTVFGIAVWPF